MSTRVLRDVIGAQEPRITEQNERITRLWRWSKADSSTSNRFRHQTYRIANQGGVRGAYRRGASWISSPTSPVPRGGGLDAVAVLTAMRALSPCHSGRTGGQHDVADRLRHNSHSRTTDVHPNVRWGGHTLARAAAGGQCTCKWNVYMQ
jgi:hypothetical protein